MRCPPCRYSWFYVVLNVAALVGAPAVDLMRTYIGGSCVEIKAFAVPCFSAYRAIIFSVSFPPFFTLTSATRLWCQINFGWLQGFVATAVNFGLSLWMPLTKEVAMGKGKPLCACKFPLANFCCYCIVTNFLSNALAKPVDSATHATS